MLLLVCPSTLCLAITDVVDDIKETNEFIDDTEINNSDLLSQDEIAALREQGVSAEELIQRQIERHDRFELKTEFSKEKWRQRKEKKYVIST
jgi:tRNA (adenine-N(1)-)-methyltransferase non-catalytic subunit